jgi:hypothetical protein
VAAQLLAGAGDDAAVDEVDEPVGEQFRVDAEVAVPRQGAEDGVTDAADADLQRRAIGDLLHDCSSDALVALVRKRRRDLDERTRRLAPPDDLRDVDLVEPERARHPRIGLEEEGHASDHRRHVLGVRPEAEVTVGVGHARSSDHERAARAAAHQFRDL